MSARGLETGGTTAWMLRPRPNPRADLRLFCLPHAGGDTWIFHDWQQSLPAHVEVCSIRLPGRGSRMSEAPYLDLHALTDALGRALSEALDRPFAIFGHSMGALIGFELARWFRQVHGRSPAMLCVASCRAPRLVNPYAPISQLPPYLLLDALRQRYGAGHEMAGNPELMRLMLPILRADLALCESYRYEAHRPLDCPIIAYGGTHDPMIDAPALEAWGEETSASFLPHIVAGDHFFPVESKHALLPLLASHLELCMCR